MDVAGESLSGGKVMKFSLSTLAIGASRLFLSTGTGLAAAESAPPPAIAFRQDDAKGQMQVLIGGKEALVYVYSKDWDLPHLFPIRSPSGKSMTVERTEPYPHHRSFWFADTVVLGKERPANDALGNQVSLTNTVELAGNRRVSFYFALESGTGDKKNLQPPFRDRVRHVAFTEQRPGAGKAQLGLKLVWEMDDGKTPVLDEARQMRIVALGEGEYLLDITFTLKASYGEVTFKSDGAHYAWPYVRMNSDFNTNGSGLLVNSEGGTAQAGTHDKPARWVDFSRTGVPDAEGLALFSHPSNPQPHSWLTRDYGTFGPRREAARNGKPFTLKTGETISTRCGVLVHKGDVKSGRVAERFQAYADGKL